MKVRIETNDRRLSGEERSEVRGSRLCGVCI